jgi:hypothetical protein
VQSLHTPGGATASIAHPGRNIANTVMSFPGIVCGGPSRVVRFQCVLPRQPGNLCGTPRSTPDSRFNSPRFRIGFRSLDSRFNKTQQKVWPRASLNHDRTPEVLELQYILLITCVTTAGCAPFSEPLHPILEVLEVSESLHARAHECCADVVPSAVANFETSRPGVQYTCTVMQEVVGPQCKVI